MQNKRKNVHILKQYFATGISIVLSSYPIYYLVSGNVDNLSAYVDSFKKIVLYLCHVRFRQELEANWAHQVDILVLTNN